MTTSFHPQANGMVERVHRQLKDALPARDAGASWPDHLPYVLLGLHAAPKESSGISSAEMVFGEQLTLPRELLHVEEAPARDFLSRLQSAAPPPTCLPRTYAQVAAAPRVGLDPLQQASHVYVRRGAVGLPLTPAYVGPYRVLRKHEKYYVLEVGEREETVSVDRLKPHTGTTLATPAAPPARGRPRKLPRLSGQSAPRGPSQS